MGSERATRSACTRPAAQAPHMTDRPPSVDPEVEALASKLLAEAEAGPAVRITDRAKAMDYFRGRVIAELAKARWLDTPRD